MANGEGGPRKLIHYLGRWPSDAAINEHIAKFGWGPENDKRQVQRRRYTIPEQGLIYWNTTTSELRMYIGSTWQPIPGSGGTTLTVEDEGVLIDASTTLLDFVGGGVTATQTAPGQVQVSVPAGATADKRGPAVIVGNAAAGDTLDDCDYLDTGNGAQLDAAIQAAGGASPPQDVWVRPGVYDLGVGGAPAGPIDIPIGVTVRGAGIGSVQINTKAAGFFGAFTMQDRAELEDVYIEVPFPTGPSVGLEYGVVEFQGMLNRCRRVEVYFVNYQNYSPVEKGFLNMRSAFFAGLKDNFGKFFDCVAVGPSIWDGDGNPGAQQNLSGFRFDGFSLIPQPNAYFNACDAIGFDMGFFATGISGGGFECHGCRSIEPVYSGYWHYGESRSYLDHCYSRLADSGSVEFGLPANTLPAPSTPAFGARIDLGTGEQSSIIGCFMEYAGIDAGIRGIVIEADNNIINANRLTGFVTAIDMPGALDRDNIVSCNRTMGGAITNASGLNLVVNNVTAP